MPQRLTWLALSYQVPANPSKSRVYVWRRLKELGAGYFRQGVAILPSTPRNMTQFRMLGTKIREMGGDATLAELKFCDMMDEAQTIAWFRSQSDNEYQKLLQDCAGLLSNQHRNDLPDDKPEHVKRLIRRYDRVRSRDHFRSGVRDDLISALDELAGDIGDLGKQLRNMLD